MNERLTVTEYQLSMMKHSIGLNYSRKPYRHRFYTHPNDPDWNYLVEKGLAFKGEIDPNNNDHCYFWLSKPGVELVVGKKMSDKAYEKL
jgi:hypothetical protein